MPDRTPLSDEELEAISEKLLAKLLDRLARRTLAENDSAIAATSAEHKPDQCNPAPRSGKKHAIQCRDVKPTLEDYERAAKWQARRARKLGEQ